MAAEPSWLEHVTEYGLSGVRLAGPGGINQVEEPFDRFPQFVLRVAAVATVLAPPVMIPVLVADLARAIVKTCGSRSFKQLRGWVSSPGRSTNLPLIKVVPARTRATMCGPRNQCVSGPVLTG